MRSENKILLLTGSSSGIGWQICQSVSNDFTLFAGVKNEEQAEKIRSLGRENVIPIQLDVRNSGQISAALEEISERGGGKLYAIINCAVVAHSGPIEWIPKEQLEDQFDTNLFGPIELVQKAIPLLVKEKGSRIIFMGSMAGVFTKPLTLPYSMTKFSLEALVDGLRIELKTQGIYTSLITPSNSPTPIWDKSLVQGRKLLSTKTAAQRAPYSFILDRMESFSIRGTDKGIPPQKIAEGILKVIRRAKPPIRKRIGISSNWMYFVSLFLPYSMRDWIIMRRMKKAKKD